MRKEMLSAAPAGDSPTRAGGSASRGAPPRRRRTQAERSTETRAKLINAAITLVHESGFSRLTIHDVARRAGLTSGAVQHHFLSSAELLRAVAEAVFPILQLSIEEVASTKLPLKQRVHRLVDIYWDLYRSPEYLVIWELMFGTRGSAEIQTVLLSMQKDMVTSAVADLVKAFADIGLRKVVAFALWTFITSHLRGLALLSMFEGDRVLDTDVRYLKEAAYNLLTQENKERAQ